MKRTERTLTTFRETVSEIFRLAAVYAEDMRPVASMGLHDFFGWLSRLQYRPDPKGVEHVSRPAYTMREEWDGPRDCDDKTVLAGAYFTLRGIPWRIAVVGKGDRPHHVYPEIPGVVLTGSPNDSRWIAFDATFPDRATIGNRLYADPETKLEKWREVFPRP